MTKLSQKLEKIITALQPYERYFFLLMIVLHLIPLFLSPYFITVDGPAHLYNSRLILDLLGNSTGHASEFYSFTPYLIPNFTGHGLLALLMTCVSAAVAEKILLSGYVVGLSLGFRYLFNTLELKRAKYLTYFIFPFTYSFLFYYGFYNFNIGLVLYFFTIALWIRSIQSGFSSVKQSILLSVLTVVLFFSHLFVLAVLLLSIGALFLVSLWNSHRDFSSESSSLSRSIWTQLLVLLPAIGLLIFYFLQSELSTDLASKLTMSELWKTVVQASPAKGISYGKEVKFTQWIFILCTFLFALTIASKLMKKNSESSSFKLLFGGLSALCFLAMFILPDGTSTFGFLSTRLLLFTYLFFIVYLGFLHQPNLVKVVVFLLISYVNFALLKVYITKSQEMATLSSDIQRMADLVPPDSVVLPVCDNDYFLFGHISNYLGADKSMVILENYEATQSYFPLRWNSDKVSVVSSSHGIKTPKELDSFSSNEILSVDFVFLLTNEDSGNNAFDNQSRFLDTFSRVDESDDNRVRLFMRKEVSIEPI